ncbi:hypothetical protein B0H12DRAFT_997315, partial [Mycena haematopus]
LFFYPVTSYGVSYDISTRANEDDAPNGWHSARSNIYRRIRLYLRSVGFVRDQYSDWVRHNTNIIYAWNAIWGLQGIEPPNKFSTTVRRLRINRLDNFATIEISARAQLGGGVTYLWGPTPAGLIPGGALLAPLPAPIVGPFAPPKDTQPGPGANNPANW